VCNEQPQVNDQPQVNEHLQVNDQPQVNEQAQVNDQTQVNEQSQVNEQPQVNDHLNIALHGAEYATYLAAGCDDRNRSSAVIDLKAASISLSALNPVLFIRLFRRLLLNSLSTCEKSASIGWNSGLYPMFHIGSMFSFGHYFLTQGFLWILVLSMNSETEIFLLFFAVE